MKLTITYSKQIDAHTCGHCGMMYSIAGVVRQSDDDASGERRYALIEQDASAMHCPYCGKKQGEK